MDLNEIESILQSESKLKVCPICGTPFKPYHSRQKTCGSEECKNASKSESVKKRSSEKKAENPEEYKKSRRNAMRRYRRKRQALKIRESQLKELSEQWERQLNFDRKVSEYGLEYGKQSAEKVLATVPKIDVNIHERGEPNEQSVLREEELHQ